MSDAAEPPEEVRCSPGAWRKDTDYPATAEALIQRGGKAAMAVALALLAAGCAARSYAPRELRAVPAGEGQVRLTWEPDPRADGFVVERRGADGEWRQVADAAALPGTSVAYVDTATAEREQRSYRVATVSGNRRSDWVAADAVPGFVGKPLHGWLDASTFETCRIAGYGPARGLQCALEALGGRTEPGADPTVGPHVLWIPPGTHRVTRTLWLEGRAGVQVVGSPGDTVLRWAGSRGEGPDATRVMFHAEGNRDSTWRGLVWDGGCADPAACWVVAFDQSYCGRSDLPILRSTTCDADELRWPERATVGESDNGSAHFDSTFRNAYIGLRIGHHGVADDTATHRRSTFENNFVGVSLEDFNALRHWFWDPTFERNFVGITNNTPDVLHTHDPSYAPGWCRGELLGCYSGADCDGTVCEWTRRWAGDYAIFRGRFRDNAWADIWAEPTGEFVVRESTSSGSQRFFFAGGPNATPGRFSLIGNHVYTEGGSPVRGRTPGPFLFLDDVFLEPPSDAFRVDGPAGRFDSVTGPPGLAADVGTVDLLSAGNAFAARERWRLDGPARLLDSDDRAAKPSDVAVPRRSIVVDPLEKRPVYTVIGANTLDAERNADVIQSVIDAAAADPRPAIVHFPGVDGRYLVGRRLRVPPGSDLVLLGDGAWTTLQWVGAKGESLFDIDATAIRGLTLRDLQVRHAGVVVRNLARESVGVLLSQVRIAEAGSAGLVVDGLRGTSVDIADLQANGGLLAGGAGLGVVLRDSDVRLWSGITLRNDWDFDVIHDEVGARVLLENNYMENSRHHLRVRGRAEGQVVLHGSKAAVVVAAEVDLDDATTAILVEGGTVDLVQSQVFVIPPAGPRGSSQAAADHGARIRVGAGAKVRSVGSTVRTGVEYSVEDGGSLTRVGGKQALPAAAPLPNLVVTGDGVRTLRDDESRAALEASTALLREVRAPPFYDHQSARDRFRIRLDKVFLVKAPGVGLHLVGTAPCTSDRDCVGGCNRSGLQATVPGRCD